MSRSLCLLIVLLASCAASPDSSLAGGYVSYWGVDQCATLRLYSDGSFDWTAYDGVVPVGGQTAGRWTQTELGLRLAPDSAIDWPDDTGHFAVRFDEGVPLLVPATRLSEFDPSRPHDGDIACMWLSRRAN